MYRARNRIAKTIPTFLAVALLMTVLWTPVAAYAGRHDAGWTEYCPYDHTLTDDPIFLPGQNGASPAMDFFGATNANADSTFDTLRSSATTCLANPYDTSAYYTPRMFKNGNPVQAKTMFEYYWAPKGNDVKDVVSIPSGLKMYATADHIKWTCGGGGGMPEGIQSGGASPEYGTKAPRKQYPFDCSPWPGSRVTAYIFLPNCWDQSSLEPDSMSYPSKTGCPSGDKVLPGLYLGENWFLTDGTGATFSTGDYKTFRGMFFDAWDAAEMDRLIGACMDNGRWCGAWTHSGQNKPPVVKAAQIMPKDVHDTDTPKALAVNPHDPDGDPFTLHYQWQANGQNVGTDSDTLDSHQFQPGDSLTVTITAEDDQGNWSVPKTSKPSIVDYDVVCPRSGKPGGLLQKVHGGGFGKKENVSLRLDAQNGKVLATVKSDVLGLFPETNVPLPSDISGGAHKLYGVGASSGIVGWGPFTVGSMGGLSPTAVAAGQTITFTGSGYVPGETVTMTFPNNPPQNFTADPSGSVVAPLVAPAEPGPNQSLAVTSSEGSFDFSYRVLPTLDLPSSGEPGVAMSYAVSGFGRNETVKVLVDDVDSGRSFSTDASGSASGQVAIATTFGQHQLKFVGQASGISASTHVAMPAYVSVNPVTGPVGTSVTISSLYGWPQGDAVSLYWNKVKVDDLVVDGSGSVSTVFTVPAHKPGTVQAKLMDTALGVSPSADFTITMMGDLSRDPQNSAPSILAVLIDGYPYTNAVFTGVAHGVKDPDGDPVTLHYTWKVNGNAAGGDTSTYSSSSLKAGDVVDLWIRPEDNHGNWGAAVEANSTLTLKWEVDAADAQPSLTSHPFYLYNFQPFEMVDVRLDSTSGAILDKIKVNDSGNAQHQQVPMPWGIAGGTHVVYAVGETSGIVGQGPIVIHAIAYNVPGSLHVGDVTTINASGFVPGESVTASFPGAQGVSKAADSTGSVTMDLTMPEEPYPGGNITVRANSATTTAPYKVLSSMLFSETQAEPMDSVPFELHGYAAGEKVEASIDGQVTQTYTTGQDGSLHSTMVMDATFGKHRIVLHGLKSEQQHNWKISLLPYMDVTPNPAHPGTTITITSLYGWAGAKDKVYVYFGKQVIQVLHPDADGSIRTTYQIPTTQKSGVVSMKLLDTVLGKFATFKLTIEP
jgi:hypothetical protein